MKKSMQYLQKQPDEYDNQLVIRDEVVFTCDYDHTGLHTPPARTTRLRPTSAIHGEHVAPALSPMNPDSKHTNTLMSVATVHEQRMAMRSDNYDSNGGILAHLTNTRTTALMALLPLSALCPRSLEHCLFTPTLDPVSPAALPPSSSLVLTVPDGLSAADTSASPSQSLPPLTPVPLYTARGSYTHDPHTTHAGMYFDAIVVPDPVARQPLAGEGVRTSLLRTPRSTSTWGCMLRTMEGCTPEEHESGSVHAQRPTQVAAERRRNSERRQAVKVRKPRTGVFALMAATTSGEGWQ